ncbi:MAG TPA: NCS1 family nucleobase:cation symporter-1 [Rubrobacteraceae bacterium]|nr:NCS1 family nucleobase:cation symporter-1 [Rubrobacteraceae bacterium]
MSERPLPASYSDRLYNEDLAPVTERTWTGYSLFAMWMADVHSIGGYTFAAGLFFLGLAGWEVFLALLAGITAVYFLMNLTGLAGQRNGIPYPVLARISFGVFGANIPALIRAIIAIFWYGIQTWLASVAVVILLLRIFPGLEPYTQNSILGLSTLGWICFLALWGAQLFVLRHGMETVRRFVDWAGPAIYVAMFALAIWILIEAGGKIDFSLGSKDLSAGGAVLAFFTAASLVVAYFSTLLLNFCDFSRFSPSERMVKVGNFWGLPVNFTAFSLVTVIVTAGSVAVYGKAITDPVQLVAKIPNTFVLIVGAVTFAVATVGINIVANFVSPAYDLSNVAPKYIDFKRGGLITALLALLVTPWNIYSSPVAVNYFLGGLGAFLGPLFGILMVDYYLVRRGQVDVEALYRAGESEPYWYQGGVNRLAVGVFVISAAVAALIALVPAFSALAPFSWFVGAGLSGAMYWALARRGVERTPETAA